MMLNDGNPKEALLALPIYIYFSGEDIMKLSQASRGPRKKCISDIYNKIGLK